MSACSILLVSANRHTSPYPVYPLGLSYLKTYLERTINGIRVDIADCNLLSDAQLAERIRTLAPRYIGLSLRNVDGANSLDRRGFLPQYRALADVIRAASDAPLIIGGAGFSIYPEAFMRELGADYGIHGEGEEPLAELIGALERGRTEIDIPSVYTRDGRRGSGRRSYLPSIEVQFEPELTGYYWKRSGMLNIQTKRGCPYDCIYCSYPSIDGRCVRTMDPEAIAENILRAKRDYGISYLFFTDSVFNIGPEYNVRLAETLIRRRTDIRWGAYFSLIGCAVIVGLNVWLVPRYGYLASAWASVAGYGVITLLSYFIGQRKYPIRYDVRGMAVYLLLAAVLYAASTFIGHLGLPFALRLLLNTLLLLIFAAYILKKDLPARQLPFIGRFFRRT